MPRNTARTTHPHPGPARLQARPRLLPGLLLASFLLTAPACDTPPNTPVHDGAVADERGEATLPRSVPDTGPGAPDAEALARSAASRVALQPVRTDWSGGDAAEGRLRFAEHCVECHGPEGEGNGVVAPALNPKPRDFTSGVFYIDADADAETGEPADLARVIRYGPGTFGGSSAMPPWGDVFTEAQIRDLVAYVLSLDETESG